ncbi:SCAN domain-containing protein 3-like [Macrobrachium rosenbergii]|uniref:SCAN domain-containing protein 3-like n=1 Tax=Macrobrachium rosenbergii TaxID=79674 RepID=UPI0034D5A800
MPVEIVPMIIGVLGTIPGSLKRNLEKLDAEVTPGLMKKKLTAIDKSGKKTPHEYYLLKKYEILKCGDVLKLIRRRTANEDPIYFATSEDTFDIIKRAHIATGHGGRDKMVKELSKKSQVDLVDMQAMKQGNYKWIMVYQDHLTKFCVLRPLTSKRAAEVAYQLYHSGIRRSPFAALFGSDAKVGLTTSALPHDLIHRLQSEDDLLAVITEETTSDEPPAVEPVTAKPPAVEPVTAEPPAVEPVTAEPPAVEQVTAEPPAVEQVTALGVLCTTVIRG